MPRLLRDPQFDSPYDQELKGILSFKRFSDAERTIRMLENLRRRFLDAHDNRGLACCRQVALTGRKRAEQISRNRRNGPAKRRHKSEIARWFQIWLENPDIFDEWLVLRKSTQEFQELTALEEPEAGPPRAMD